MQVITRYSWLLLILVVLFGSCSTQRRANKSHTGQDSIGQVTPVIDTPVVVQPVLDTPKVVRPQVDTPKVEVTQRAQRWQTFQTPSAVANITIGSKQYTVKSQVQALWDSLLVLSVAPAMGIEMLRMEATPTTLMLLDKVHKRYSLVSYNEANKLIRPAISYADLQDICTGELPAIATNGQLLFRAMGQNVGLKVRCQQARVNEPLSINRIDLHRFTRVDLKTLLQ